MGYNDFQKIATSFIVQNIAPNNKRIRIFNYPINNGETRDLLAVPGISEADIRVSLLKGELFIKIVNEEIKIIQSDIDLLQFNQHQKTFLESAGVNFGHQIDLSVIDPAIANSFNLKQDVELIGSKDSVNLQYMIPSGKFIYSSNYRITVYLNGVRQQYTQNYMIAESQGVGTGYDTVIFIDEAPDPGDIVVADYYQTT